MLTNKREIRFFIFLTAILFVLLAVSFFVARQVEERPVQTPTKTVADAFLGINLTAKSAYVLDARTGKVLYTKNPDERLPLASLVKVMTALTAVTIAPDYSTIVITREAIETDGDSGLEVGEKWSLKNLLDFSLTSSSNDGARAVGLALGALGSSTASTSDIENDFIRSMNKEALSIGMTSTSYFNDTGLDISTSESGALGTAKDMATLFDYILKNHPSLMEATQDSSIAIPSESGITHLAKNTDQIVNQIPGILASKTGYTDLAGGNLVVAFDPEIGRPIIIALLGSTEEGRFTDMNQLVDASLASLENSIESRP